MDKCKDCGMQEPHWCCYSPEPTIEERLGKIESQLSELIELLSCDDCDCEDEEEPTPDIHFEDGECTICDKCEKCDETLCQCDCVDPSVPSKWAQD